MSTQESLGNWRPVLVLSSVVGAVVWVLAILVGWIAQGGPAAASAALGAGAVVVLSFIALLIIDWSQRRAPQLTIPLLMGSSIVRLGALLLVLLAFDDASWVRGEWTLFSAVAAVIAWQTAEILGFRRMRLGVQQEPEETQ